ncbi:hypothetical protein HJFPF1_01060 [Paramyrothecium foliicola]|nr:hypothetical protein HJFPF1_01060 [Paramyrothecium foliicola]
MGTSIASPDLGSLLAPILPALPAAAVSTEPATGILPFLSPILRQRVQLLSSSSTEGWLRLLCYDTSKAAKLADLVGGGSLEPHPVSGEVEVDWDYDSQTRYRRLDEETLQALVVLSELGLAFQLIYCVGDAEGGGDGWRVGEVTVAEKPAPFAQFGGGAASVEEAEAQHKESQASKQTPALANVQHTTNAVVPDDADDEDDGGYWDQYDATPAQTPGAEQSKFPPPDSAPSQGGYRPPSADDDYYARYDSVQPAMDNHDPDEAAQQAHFAPPPLGLGAAAPPPAPLSTAAVENHNRALGSGGLVHPRPESSASSKGSNTVAKLEATAGKQEQSEFGVKQHISRSIRSLYMLARASGIEREEFERLVKTELDVLGMVEEQDDASN